MSTETETDNIVDNAVAQGGAYDVIRGRLVKFGSSLESKTQHLNQQRQEEFGGTEMAVAGRVRVRTEHNCLARDIVRVGDVLLFGYNVFIGLKKETKITDVFSLYKLTQDGENFDIEPVTDNLRFLNEPNFVKDFTDLYAYYKDAKLLQLVVRDSKLLACFQMGERIQDIRVFRWQISTDETEVSYIDNRGERDISPPPRHDFEWTQTEREDQINGRHPHINILDKVFVETVGGDLTIKVEDNTEDGQGIYRELVDDQTQSLGDAEIYYAELGKIILLKMRPYREENWRYLIFNSDTNTVLRNDAIGQSCVQLPEDHGIIFPGGIYLESDEFKKFDDNVTGMRFKRAIRSPNGEDVLYCFYEEHEGKVAFYNYNLINKSLQNPIFGHGYSLFGDGQMVIFNAEGDQATRIHPMQVWNTPFMSEVFASQIPQSQSFFGKIGNAELVRGISDFFSIARMIDNQAISSQLYNNMSRTSMKMFDNYHWIISKQLDGIDAVLRQISETAELVLDEFEKVESIRKKSIESLADAETTQKSLLTSIQAEQWGTAEEYIDALDRLRKQRGHLLTIRDYRYINVDAVDTMEQQVIDSQDALSLKTVEFLSNENALKPYYSTIDSLDADVEAAQTIVDLDPIVEAIEKLGAGLDLLSELMTSLSIDDATVRTQIIESISQVYSQSNQSKARAKHKRKSLHSTEAVAQFAAQFKLFSQTISNALGLSTTPDKCDEQLSRLLIQLEELESQFSDHDEFLNDIISKREEIYDTFEGHKSQLVEAAQRKARSLADAAERILNNLGRRSQKFTEVDELNTYFASDNLVLKVKDLAEQLRELGDAVKADDIQSQLKSAKDNAIRALRDKTDIYEDGGQIIKLGPRHKFSVNTQELDLTIIPRNDTLQVHLTGTDFFEEIQNDQLTQLKDYWDMTLESETDTVAKVEYLTSQLIHDVRQQKTEFDYDTLRNALPDEEQLLQLIRSYTAPRYKEAYEKGIHDHDAAKLLQKLVPILDSAGLLQYAPLVRGLAAVFWANTQHGSQQETWILRAQSAKQMQAAFKNDKALQLLSQEIQATLSEFISQHSLAVDTQTCEQAAFYLTEELACEHLEFIESKYAKELVATFKDQMQHQSAWKDYQDALKKMEGHVGIRWQITESWLTALVESHGLDSLAAYIPEAIAILNAEGRVSRLATEVDLELTVSDLMSEHRRITDRSLNLSLDEFTARLSHHRNVVIPSYRQFLQLRLDIAEEEKDILRLHEFKPQPLTSFVRNRLINEVYLPMIGDNLAKQMGTVGDDKRTDLMGLLMMISPPGYGKTTLMEYTADRLGLIFMKINCPSLGHDVMSLDPAIAPNATAKQELEKLNLAFEMGNNVMLYLDDIQHTHPEFLQKFISLCDGTRRTEGVWKGKTKTYDMRGKKFCIVMAGNPYTESGELFKIPDMLANRADIYNLGDVLSGTEEAFELSYIENSLTSNAVLAPLATRDMKDVYTLIDMAKGKEVATTDLVHDYSAAEVAEIVDVLKKMFVIQGVILKVNQQYIISAATDNKYRVEPSFKLQGSYRNMNKMTEKVSAIMNDEELLSLIGDHYQGEAQLLTTGAEENLLKLSQLRGNATEAEEDRWQSILKDFSRSKAMGGDDADVGQRVVAQLVDVSEHLSSVNQTLSSSSDSTNAIAKISDVLSDKLNLEVLGELTQSLQQAPTNTAAPTENTININMQPIADAINDMQVIMEKAQYHIKVINEPLPQVDHYLKVISDTFQQGIMPLVQTMEGKLELDLGTHRRMQTLIDEIKKLAGKNI
ncbi:MAG: AAA domain-containing protein [Methylococcales bacterium]|nr:AAA domain-containing protein [Methylococcales bacterium]